MVHVPLRYCRNSPAKSLPQKRLRPGVLRHLRVAPAIRPQRELGRVWNEVRPHSAVGHDPTGGGWHRVVERRAHKPSDRRTSRNPIFPAIAPDTLPEIHALEAFRQRYGSPAVVSNSATHPGGRITRNTDRTMSGHRIISSATTVVSCGKHSSGLLRETSGIAR